MTYADCQAAFDAGTFERPEDLVSLKLALAHCNFLDAAEKAGAASVEDIDEAICTSRGWPNWGLALPDRLYWAGTRDTTVRHVWFVRRARELFHDTEVEEIFLEEKIEEFLRRDASRTVWVTDGGTDWGDEVNPSACTPTELFCSLGLYNRQLNTDERLAVAYVTCSETYKPTVADAGGAFFWREGDADSTHGLTVHLETGQRTLHEWVARPGALQLISGRSSVRILDGEVNTTDAGISETYWNAGEDHVTLCRERHDNRN